VKREILVSLWVAVIPIFLAISRARAFSEGVYTRATVPPAGDGFAFGSAATGADEGVVTDSADASTLATVSPVVWLCFLSLFA
jgi:hypothetical protein